MQATSTTTANTTTTTIMGADHQFHTLSSFTTTPALTPDMLYHHQQQLTPPPTIDPVTTTLIKMEDLQCSARPSPTPSSSCTPGPTSEGGKPVKKRKSWGQVLPEPKTNLPPRKRAKTEDEKEQRRIERVKRNRLAAHNSRERKRQEVELLQAEKDTLERELQQARESMARMAAQLAAYRSRHPEDVPEQPHVDLDLTITTSIEEAEPMLHSDTICPRQASFPSPVSMDDMDTPRDDSCLPETPGFSESLVTESDQTRYPAEILCDLQCQSDSHSPSPSLLSFQLSTIFLTLFNLHLSSMTSLTKYISTLTSSMIHPSPAWPKPRRPSSTHPSFRMIQSQTLMAFLTQMMQSSSICRQTQAQQLLLATRLASQRRVSIKWAVRSTGLVGGSSHGADERRRRPRPSRARSAHQRRGSALEQEIKRSLHVFSGSSFGRRGCRGTDYKRRSVS